jgi:hypothetical protein
MIGKFDPRGKFKGTETGYSRATESKGRDEGLKQLDCVLGNDHVEGRGHSLARGFGQTLS